MVRAGSAVRIPHFLLTLIRQRFSQVLACPRHMLFHGQGGSFWVAFLYGNKDRQMPTVAGSEVCRRIYVPPNPNVEQTAHAGKDVAERRIARRFSQSDVKCDIGFAR
jgi:hypothetical protein